MIYNNALPNIYMKSLICFFLFVSTTLASLAQSRIIGEVMDTETGAPLEYATVSLLQPGDSTLVGGGLTDHLGTFDISIAPGSYLVKVQYVSYNTSILDAVKVADNATINLGKLTLSPSTSTLSEVTVEGQREQAVLELDRRTFNIGENAVNAGRNASQILDNLPSISIDVDGNVSLRGSGNVRILINGKPSGLVGVGDTDGLRNLSGDMIERVEVITNPSARYDAQGSAGIINIVLKKKRAPGVNGSFTGNIGQPANYGAALNLNYRRDWVNFFINYGINYRRAPGSGKSYQEFYKEDTSYLTYQTQKRLRGGLSNNIRLGSDFILNDYNTLTAALLYRRSDENNISDIWYEDYTTSHQLIQRTLRTDNEQEIEYNRELEVSYKKTFVQKGRELSAIVNYRESDENENSAISNFLGTDLNNPFELQRSSNSELESQWLMQADYIHPFLENAKFETGYRSTLRSINNNYLVEEQQENGSWDNLPQFTNNFVYNENIYAAYAILSNKTGSWSYQGGLRAEASDITTRLIETNERSDKDYINFFPSLALTYSFGKEKSLQGSYSRRINRPGFRSLNPFSSFSNSRNIRTGNPDLDPEFTDSYEVGYLHNFKAGNIYLGSYYRHTDDVVERVSRVEPDGITYTRPENLSTQNSFGIEMNTNLDLFPWWNINGNFNFYRAITHGTTGDLVLSSDTYTSMTRLNSKWKMKKLFDVQFNAFYMAPERRPQGLRKAFYAFDLGLTKEILNRKGMLMLNVQDLLNSRRFRYTTEVAESFQDSEFQWRSRQITLSFTYRLNQLAGRGDRGGRGNGERSGGGGMDGGGEF